MHRVYDLKYCIARNFHHLPPGGDPCITTQTLRGYSGNLENNEDKTKQKDQNPTDVEPLVGAKSYVLEDHCYGANGNLSH